MKLREAIFISGAGSNLKAVLDHFPNKKPYIYANKPCSGLAWAKRRGCYTEVKPLKSNVDWVEFAQDLNGLGIKRILLLGFMKIIPEEFLEKFQGLVINLHPSLLPSYPGLKSIERAFKEGASLGVTLHQATQGVDEGPVVFQKEVEATKSLKEAYEMVHLTEQKLVCKYLNLVSF